MPRYTHIILGCLAMTFAACQDSSPETSTPKGPMVIEPNPSAKRLKDPLPDFYDPSASETALTALPDPTAQLILDSSESIWYQYLLNSFDTLSSRQVYSSVEGRICSFAQEFASGIYYDQNNCPVDSRRIYLYYPGTSPDDVVDWYNKMNRIQRDSSLLVEFEWDADSSYFIAQTDSLLAKTVQTKIIPDSSGCGIRIYRFE